MAKRPSTTIKKIAKLMRDLDFCMLTTHTKGGGVHARAQLLDPACRSALPQPGLAERRELRDVGARDEGPLAGALEHDRAHPGVRVERDELRLELLEKRRREGVHGRVVDGDDRDHSVAFALCELAH